MAGQFTSGERRGALIVAGLITAVAAAMLCCQLCGRPENVVINIAPDSTSTISKSHKSKISEESGIKKKRKKKKKNVTAAGKKAKKSGRHSAKPRSPLDEPVNHH